MPLFSRRFLPVCPDHVHEAFGSIKVDLHPLPARLAYDLLHQETIRVKPAREEPPEEKPHRPQDLNRSAHPGLGKVEPDLDDDGPLGQDISLLLLNDPRKVHTAFRHCTSCYPGECEGLGPDRGL